MEIMELFDESTMNLDLQGETKDQIIEEMVTPFGRRRSARRQRSL